MLSPQRVLKTVQINFTPPLLLPQFGRIEPQAGEFVLSVRLKYHAHRYAILLLKTRVELIAIAWCDVG
jgi:hypothetical protein